MIRPDLVFSARARPRARVSLRLPPVSVVTAGVMHLVRRGEAAPLLSGSISCPVCYAGNSSEQNSAAKLAYFPARAFPPPDRPSPPGDGSARLDFFRHPECICQVGPVSRRGIYSVARALLFANDSVQNPRIRATVTRRAQAVGFSLARAELTRPSGNAN